MLKIMYFMCILLYFTNIFYSHILACEKYLKVYYILIVRIIEYSVMFSFFFLENCLIFIPTYNIKKLLKGINIFKTRKGYVRQLIGLLLCYIHPD